MASSTLTAETERWAAAFSATRSHGKSLLLQPRAHLWAWGLLAIGILASLTDGVSTWIALSSGEYAEANSYAADGMGAVGMELYIIGATLISLLLSSLTLVRGGTALTRTIWIFALFFIAGKVLTVLGNFFQWDGLLPF